MFAPIQKLKIFIHGQQTEKTPATPKPIMKAVVPLFARSKRPGAAAEKLYSQLCNCKKPINLLAVKDNLCLLACDDPHCKKRLFRIDTNA